MKRNIATIFALLLTIPLLLTSCGANGGTEAVNTEQATGGEADPINPFLSVQSKDYTKGTLEDGVYKNPWAGIQITVPDELSQGSHEQYASVSKDENTECGLYLSNGSADQTLFIGFQKLSLSVGAESYLNKVSQTLKETAEKTDGLSVEAPTSFSSVNLGGNEYIKGRYLYTVSDKTAYQDYYVRQLDDLMIFIVCTADSTNKVDSLASLVHPCY